ncbi:helix-turn-helix transcriptional regulator [Lachnospiraceae bacterium DSM 108991]|uniref:Helix-turn-helix transcriptional regulator n=1 Tax=Claveliimonas monacensis TaxID=2779351 RepID=A0ABR9RK74_9FIRM|nr:helix-turn-helix transcriptional regulator [Claveliimonas monacensis]MBE5063002.1 helix-turn-helix transcriptional regulator [Claveliimonas monacensis]
MNNNSDLNVFRLLRIARNKRIKEVADELSITPAYVHAIESGKNFPSGRLLRDYAKVLGVSEETILNFKPEENKKDLVFENTLLRLLQIICNNMDSK